jgi:hypothetical protein
VYDQKFENSFSHHEPRIMLQKSIDISKLKVKKSISSNKVQIQDINLKVSKTQEYIQNVLAAIDNEYD